MNIKQWLGVEPKIERAPADEASQWSPTVVNINRMRLKSRQKKMLVLGGLGLLVLACLVFGVVSNLYTSMQQPAQAAASPATATLQAWTPVAREGTLRGMVAWRLATFTPPPSPLATPSTNKAAP